jgi:hypothetical protein
MRPTPLAILIAAAAMPAMTPVLAQDKVVNPKWSGR